MKKYRPNTKAIIVGIIFMLAGIACWVIKASFIPNGVEKVALATFSSFCKGLHARLWRTLAP